jgi:TonB family protein
MTGPIISADWVGRVIDGRFALLDWIGGSGHTGIFRTELQQPVEKRAAIKLIATEGDGAKACIAAWAKASNLSHPHLIRVYRSGRFQFGSIDLAYVVTEYADEVLSQIIPERPLSSDETRAMLGPVIDALEYLHGKGFVHGHLKPSNILVVDEQLKISADSLTQAGEARNRFLPTSVYDAPELASGRMTPGIDAWALGATAVEALTQRPSPWDRERSREPIVPEGLPRLFAEIARGCLRRDPNQRLTLADVKALLESNQPIAFVAKKPEALPETGAAARGEEDSAGLSEARSKARRWLLVAGLPGALILLALLLMMRGHSKPVAPQRSTTVNTPIESGATIQGAGSSRSAEARSNEAGKVAQRTMPSVTDSARKTIRGAIVVTVRVSVDANGEVTQAKLRSGGNSRYFANAALKAAWSWKFNPPLREGRAAASIWTVRFKFRRAGDEASATEGRL